MGLQAITIIHNYPMKITCLDAMKSHPLCGGHVSVNTTNQITCVGPTKLTNQIMCVGPTNRPIRSCVWDPLN